MSSDKGRTVWTVAGDDALNERTGTETITASESSITVGGDVYVRDNSEAGRSLIGAFDAGCAK